MNLAQTVCIRNIEVLKNVIARTVRSGELATVELVQLKAQEACLAMSKAGERLELFREAGGDDRYSAQVAGTHLRAAADLLHDAARIAEGAARDPHRDVLREAGIRDTLKGQA